MGTQSRGVQGAGCETVRGPRVAGQEECLVHPGGPAGPRSGRRAPEGKPSASQVWG